MRIDVVRHFWFSLWFWHNCVFCFYWVQISRRALAQKAAEATALFAFRADNRNKFPDLILSNQSSSEEMFLTLSEEGEGATGSRCRHHTAGDEAQYRYLGLLESRSVILSLIKLYVYSNVEHEFMFQRVISLRALMPQCLFWGIEIHCTEHNIISWRAASRPAWATTSGYHTEVNVWVPRENASLENV